MRLALIGATLLISLTPFTASAQDWKEWQRSNPTYPSQQPTSAPSQESPTANGSKSRIFLDQKKTIAAGYEWNREIIATKAGTFTIQVASGAPKSIIVMTAKAHKALLAGNMGAIDKDKDMILVDETTETIYERDIALPVGSFIIMMENRSSSSQELHLRCSTK
ncbi:MAG: hypothetical protein WA902_11015 [Thermosynechococcaceae cyanobacterium]